MSDRLTELATGACVSVDIRVPGFGRLIPSEDITPRESCLIAMMLAVAASVGSMRVDCAGFISEHKLERHFKP